MPILLPNLDDRTWADLVEEALTLIPFYGPEWTDQNYSDPGITLMEQLASITEMDVFELNRITDASRLKFLAMVGIRPIPPLPARTPLSFSLAPGAPIALPSGAIFSGLDPLGVATPFRTLAPIDIVPANLAAVQVKDSSGFRNLTDRWTRGISFGIFGDVATPATELYLGFDQTLKAGQQFSLYFGMAGGRSGLAQRRQILQEASAAAQTCQPVVPACASTTTTPAPSAKSPAALPPFAGVRLTWQVLTASGWVTTPIADDTRAFTLDGAVLVTPPQDVTPQKLGKVTTPLAYLRVQFTAGAYDAPPIAQTILLNAVLSEQSVPVSSLTWTIAAGVVASPAAPPSAVTGIKLQFDPQNNITSLQFVAGAPEFRILAFTAATAADPGSLTVELALLGTGDGTPWQQFTIPQAPVKQDSLALLSFEDSAWHTWRLRPDFDASTRADRDFLLDPTAGTITFGDGDQGVVPRVDVKFFLRFETTRADAGNIAAGTVNTLLDCPHNRAVLPDFADVQSRVTVKNPVAAIGGAAAEILGQAIGRAISMLAQPQRAVTLSDFETLAVQTPGTAVARAKAWANTHPSFPCVEALGMVTVIIVPAMPGPSPTPSPALRNAVASYLNRRRILGSRIAVVGPTYRTVAVQAQVAALAGASKSAVQQRIVTALNAFFDPLTGGPDSTGWPFGRDVYQTEVMQVIEQVQGVDYISSFSLLADGCTCAPQCGNICLAPAWLVAAGQHQIGVI